MQLVTWMHTVTAEQSRGPGAGLRDGPGGSLWRGRGHELRVRVWRLFSVLGLDSLNGPVQILQEDFLGDGLLDALADSWREESAHQ